MSHGSQAANRLRITPVEDRSAIGICVCNGCGSRYEPKPHQSLTRCAYCQPLVTPECLHGTSLHVPCADCFKVYGRAYMRQLPQANKVIPANTTVRAKRVAMNRKRFISSR